MPLYRIKRADDSLVPGFYSLEQAQELLHWEEAPCTLLLVTPEEMRAPLDDDAGALSPGTPLYLEGALSLEGALIWFDALARQYGPDLPLSVQGSTTDAPAELCEGAHLQRGPGGERVIVLSAQALPRREG